MKKRLLAQILAVAMILALVPTFSLAADDVEAPEASTGPVYKEAFATGHVLEKTDWRDGITAADLRTNPAAVYGKPNAVQNGKEEAFFSLRQVNEILYTFHPSEDFTREIYNYKGKDEASKPDLSLIEVTWGIWHVEAVQVYLLNATIADDEGNVIGIEEKYDIGVAFNKVGIDKGLAASSKLAQSSNIGNLAYTDIYFPSEVLKAQGVILCDVTETYNDPPSYTSYNAKDDGFDLDAICAWYYKDEPVTASGAFAIDKLVQGDDGYEAAGLGFKFAAYAEVDEDFKPVGDEPIATAETDTFGRATFPDVFELGVTYYVFEMMTKDQAEIYQFGTQNALGYIAVTAVDSDEVNADDYKADKFYNDLIPSNGTLVIYKNVGQKASYGSVTGGYAGEDADKKHGERKHQLASKIGEKGNSWFTYNDLLPLASNPEQTFDLVTGDKLTKVGEYTVSYNAADQTVTITVTPSDALELVGAPHFSIVNNLKDIKKTAPGQQNYPNSQYGWSGNTITIPVAGYDVMKNAKKIDYSVKGIDVNANAFIYIHLGLEGYEGTYGEPAGTTFAVEVTGPSYDGQIFDVPMNGSVVLENLRPGKYTVKEKASGWIATYYVGDNEPVVGGGVTVEVNNEGITTVRMTNEPGDDVEAFGAFAIEKQAQEFDGSYYGAEGFKFVAYADVSEDGKPVGEPLAEAVVSDSFGAVVFAENEAFEIGKDYYVFEEMTEEQAAIYQYGADNDLGYIKVTAVSSEEANAEGYQAAVFYNDLKLGKLVVTKDVEAKKVLIFDDHNTVTGGYDEKEGTVNAWFRPIYIDVDDILAGTPFVGDLVAGSNLTPVGRYTVSACDEGEGKFGLLVTLDYDYYYPGLICDDITQLVYGNANKGKTQSAVNEETAIEGSGLYRGAIGDSVYISADVVTAMGTGAQYLYIHSGIAEQELEVDISADYADEKFAFEVYDSLNNIVGEFELVDGQRETLELEAGEYTVVEITTGWTTTYSVENGAATVAAGQETAVTVTNLYVETIQVV